MALNGMWKHARLQRLDEVAERKQKVAQERQENQSKRALMSKKLTEDLQDFASYLHQEGIANKKQRHIEIAERKDFVKKLHEEGIADKKQRQIEIAERKKYIWDS